MAYNANIPQPNQSLNVTQSPIQQNFAEIQTLLNVNHVDFGAIDAGKHKWLTLPTQSSNPPIVFETDELALYSFLSPVTAANELYINKQNDIDVVQVPMTASIMSTDPAPNNNSSGWTYLPSGILLKWGNGNANGDTAVVFPVSATIPAFTQVVSVQVTTFANSAADTDTFVRLSAFTNLGFNCYGSARSTTGAAAASFQYLAIGY